MKMTENDFFIAYFGFEYDFTDCYVDGHLDWNGV